MFEYDEDTELLHLHGTALIFVFRTLYEGKAEVPITAEHCVKVAKVAEAMRQSYFQKKPIYFPKPEAKGEWLGSDPYICCFDSHLFVKCHFRMLLQHNQMSCEFTIDLFSFKLFSEEVKTEEAAEEIYVHWIIVKPGSEVQLVCKEEYYLRAYI